MPALEKEVVVFDCHVWLMVVYETCCGIEFDVFGHAFSGFLYACSVANVKVKQVSVCAIV